jgi:hypothetical protein
MSLTEKVAAILADTALDSEDDPRDSSRVEELQKLVPMIGWAALETEMLARLAADDDQDHWQVAAGVFWEAVLDRRVLEVDRIIAHLYFQFPSEDNLAWSITTKLKHLDYLSEYDPLQDPGVLAELGALRTGTGR